MNPQASIVIPMHNGSHFITQQLDGVLVAMRRTPEAELLVVDNRSTDGSPGLVNEWATRTGLPTRIVDAHEQAGEPYARNVGWAAARTDKILFCDADDVVSPNWASSLASALDVHPYATGPLDTHRLNDPRITDLRGQALFQSLPTLKEEIPFAHGCNMAFQRNTLESLDGFNETYLIACDIEIGVRASREGFALAWEPGALVHYRLRSTPGGVYRQAKAYGRSRRRIEELVAGAPRGPDWLQQLRRAAWLSRHLPITRSYEGTMKWAWVAGQVTGEIGGRLPWQN